MGLSNFRRAMFAAGVGLLLCSAGPGAAVRPEGKTHTVTIEGMRFQPEVLTIAAGDSVVWVNNDPFPHTATSKAGGFDSGEIAMGASWKYAPARKGESEYICTLHPTMKGVLKVE